MTENPDHTPDPPTADDPAKRETVSTSEERDEVRHGAEPDVQSDPARDDQDGGDWTSEGGATRAGPATDTHGS